MANKRTGLAPWSLSREAGIESATVDGTIDVPQILQPVINTGFVDENGNWKGIKSSDSVFHSFAKDEAIANGASILAPQIASGTIWPLDMTGYGDIQIAIKTNEAGNYAINAVMGPADLAYANLRDVNPATNLKGVNESNIDDNVMYQLFSDSAEALTADVWNIFMIMGRLRNQKLLQFKITNNSGSEANIETAFMRLV